MQNENVKKQISLIYKKMMDKQTTYTCFSSSLIVSSWEGEEMHDNLRLNIRVSLNLCRDEKENF